MWRGPYYINDDFDSHPDVPYKEGTGRTNTPTSFSTLFSSLMVLLSGSTGSQRARKSVNELHAGQPPGHGAD